MLEGRTEVGYPVGDVVNAGSAPGEETCYRAGVGSRLDEFNESDEGDVHVLLGQFFDGGTSGLRDGFEDRYGLSNGGNCDANVVERKPIHV